MTIPEHEPTTRREVIVRAAYELIAEGGIGALTHRRVAEHAGVPLGSTTYYFATLSELADAALDHAVAMAGDGLSRWVEEIRTSTDLPATLARLTQSYIADRRQSTVEFELYVAAAHRADLRPLPMVWIDGLAGILGERVAPDAAKAVVVHVDGMVLHSLITQRPPDTTALAHAFAALLGMTKTFDDSTAPDGPATREVVHPAGSSRLESVIGFQVKRLRTTRGSTLAELAERSGVSKAMLSKIENAQISCSLTTLGRLAEALDVPVTSLFRGAEQHSEAVFTAAGQGARTVARGTRVGHDYTLLGALRGPHKRMEAHLVTLTERSEEFPLFQHPGTELLYMLEGEMTYHHGGASYVMRPGDALQLDGEGTHGPSELTSLPIRFLSVVAYGGDERV